MFGFLFELDLAYHFFRALTFSHDLSFLNGLKFGCILHLHVKKILLAFFKIYRKGPFYTMNYRKSTILLIILKQDLINRTDPD